MSSSSSFSDDLECMFLMGNLLNYEAFLDDTDDEDEYEDEDEDENEPSPNPVVKQHTATKENRATLRTSDGSEPSTSKKQKLSYHASKEMQIKSTTSNALVSMDILNDDTLAEIFSYLPVKDLIVAERVSKRWREIVQMSWRRLKKLNLVQNAPEKFNLRNLECILKRCGENLVHLEISLLYEPCIHERLRTMSRYCKNLRHLKIVIEAANPKVLNSISKEVARKLKSLHIVNTGNVCDGMLSLILKKAINLEEFSISSFSFRGSSLSKLSKKCETLCIANCNRQLSNKSLANALTGLPNLKNFNVSCSNIWPSTFSSVCNQLVSLKINDAELFFSWNHRLYDKDIFVKLPFHNLKILNISACFLTNKDLQLLTKNCPLIEDLVLAVGNRIDDEGFRQLTNLQELVHLDVSRTEIGDEVLSYLAFTSNKFRRLCCVACKNITGKGLMQLIDYSPQLNYLEIGPSSTLESSFFKSALKSVEERSNHISLMIKIQQTMTESFADKDIYREAKRLNLKTKNDRPLKDSCCKVMFFETERMREPGKIWYVDSSAVNENQE